jgi:L-cysteine desulfidase
MDSLFEFKFKPTDFEKTNISIYTKLTSNKIDYTYILIAFAVVILIVINVVVLSTIKKRTRKNSHASELDKRDIKDFVHSLDEIEKIVVKQILENAREQQNTTTNQLNKLLGTDKKEFKIQNNIRSEVILNINKKFKLFSNISDDLIERERAEVDKRFMEYNINKLYLKKINTKMF